MSAERKPVRRPDGSIQVIGCGDCDRILDITHPRPGVSQFICPEHGLIANLFSPVEDS